MSTERQQQAVGYVRVATSLATASSTACSVAKPSKSKPRLPPQTPNFVCSRGAAKLASAESGDLSAPQSGVDQHVVSGWHARLRVMAGRRASGACWARPGWSSGAACGTARVPG